MNKIGKIITYTGPKIPEIVPDSPEVEEVEHLLGVKTKTEIIAEIKKLVDEINLTNQPGFSLLPILETMQKVQKLKKYAGGK